MKSSGYYQSGNKINSGSLSFSVGGKRSTQSK